MAQSAAKRTGKGFMGIPGRTLRAEFSFEKPVHLPDCRCVSSIVRPAAPRAIALDLAPAEVAARLRHLPGLVFFDTAKDDHDPAALSIVAAAPREILRGHIARDWDDFRNALKACERTSGRDDGLPHGFAGATGRLLA